MDIQSTTQTQVRPHSNYGWSSIGSLLDSCLNASKRRQKRLKPLILDPSQRSSSCEYCNSMHPLHTVSPCQTSRRTSMDKRHPTRYVTCEKHDPYQQRRPPETSHRQRCNRENSAQDSSKYYRSRGDIFDLRSRIRVLAMENATLRARINNSRFDTLNEIIPQHHASLLDSEIKEEIPSQRYQRSHPRQSTATEVLKLWRDLQSSRATISALVLQLQHSNEQWWDLWEENCSVRMLLRQVNQNNDILEDETDTLRLQIESLQEEIEVLQFNQRLWESMTISEQQRLREFASTRGNIARERDLNETSRDRPIAFEQNWTPIDQHVASTIRLYEQLLSQKQCSFVDTECLGTTSTTGQNTCDQHEKQESKIITTVPAISEWEDVEDRKLDDNLIDAEATAPYSSLYPVPSIIFDSTDFNTKDNISSLDEQSQQKPSSEGSSLFFDHQVATLDGANGNLPSSQARQSNQLVPGRMSKNREIFSSDEKYPKKTTGKEKYSGNDQRQICTSDHRDEASGIPCRNFISENREEPETSTELEHGADMIGKVYSLTFHEQLIGIHFQKAPAGNSGRLCDEENVKSSTGGDAWKKERRNTKCSRMTAADIVLVCGYTGLNENSTMRPKLGARLVAVNGVSLESGNWSFLDIRESLSSCGRPMTLSFRNDILTKEQRKIVVNAMRDIDAKSSSIFAGRRSRLCSSTLSIHGLPSDETIYFSNDYCDDFDDLSRSLP